MKSAIVLLLVFVAFHEASSARNGTGRKRGGFRHGNFRARSRAPIDETCETVQCPEGMECKMEQSRWCRRGQCLVPYCVRTGSTMMSAVDNPGACPISTVDTSAGCAGNEVESCSNDTVCAINQKCCVVGCSLQCVNVTSMALARSRATAASRFRARFMMRMSAMKHRMSMMKSGPKSSAYYCPTVPGDAFSSTCANTGCASHSDCMGNKRCCMAGCGKRCLNPVPIVSVFDGMKERSFRQRPQASTNGTFGSASRPAAAEEMTSKPGVCPTVAVDAVIDSESCVEDTDCNGTMKCCAHGQGLACMQPFRMSLPSPLMSSRLAMRLNGGDEQSLLAVRGMCPAPVEGFTCGSACTEHSNCTGQLCCPMGSCNECVGPVISSAFMTARPGICPSFSPDLVADCVVSCDLDSECEIPGTKCCPVGCGRQCINPVGRTDPMIKAGSCPVPAAAEAEGSTTNSTTQSRPSPTRFGRRGFRIFGFFDPCRFDTCRSDADCRGTRKCCRNSCGRMTCAEAV